MNNATLSINLKEEPVKLSVQIEGETSSLAFLGDQTQSEGSYKFDLVSEGPDLVDTLKIIDGTLNINFV